METSSVGQSSHPMSLLEEPRCVPAGQSTHRWQRQKEKGPSAEHKAQTRPHCSSRHCPSSPAAHLLRRMIRNSGLCRLVTDTYGSSNSCSFRTTARKQQLSSSSGQQKPTRPLPARAPQGSPLDPHTQGRAVGFKYTALAPGQGTGQVSHCSPHGAPACTTHRRKLHPWFLSLERG